MNRGAGRILCVGATPAVQRVMVFPGLELDAVNRAVETLDGAAGKSVNVAKVLQTLGCRPVATGFLGGDRGDYIRTILSGRGIELRFVTVPQRTRECITVIDRAGGKHTELVEEAPPVEAMAYEELLSVVRETVADCAGVVLSGTLASGGPPDFYAQCTRLAELSGCLSIVDAQGEPLVEALKARPGLVKPNQRELAATVARELCSENDVLSAMAELRQRGAERVVVTAGDKPTLALDGNGAWRISIPGVPVVNPIGSGDAFTAALAWRLTQGDSLGEACRWGVATGSANALGSMPGDLDKADVERLAEQVDVHGL